MKRHLIGIKVLLFAILLMLWLILFSIKTHAQTRSSGFIAIPAQEYFRLKDSVNKLNRVNDSLLAKMYLVSFDLKQVLVVDRYDSAFTKLLRTDTIYMNRPQHYYFNHADPKIGTNGFRGINPDDFKKQK